MAENYYSTEASESKFNLGLSSQEAIHNILEDIKKISINYDIKTLQQMNLLGKAQHSKYRLIRQLYLRSVPFLKEGNEKEVKDQLDKIKVCWKPRKGASGKPVFIKEFKPVSTNHEEVFIPAIDYELDELERLIILRLQKDSGIFKVKMGEESMF